MTTQVLVVGATGSLGGKIVRELVAGGASVRATMRAGSKADAVAGLRAQGVDLVTADLADEDSLAAACAGVGVVVAAVQGLREVVVDGQLRLARAAKRSGVARVQLSDYAIDFFQTTPGQNRNLDLRREANQKVDELGMRATSVLGGAFMDLLAWGAIGPDRATGVYSVWGDPDQPYDFTSTDDLAKYIAAVALDPDPPRVVRIAGDTQSPRQLAAIFEELRGTPVTIASAGTLADLDATIEKLHAADPAPENPFPRWQQLQYTRDMASGRGKLQPLDNDRYPAVRPLPVRDYLRAAKR